MASNNGHGGRGGRRGGLPRTPPGVPGPAGDVPPAGAVPEAVQQLAARMQAAGNQQVVQQEPSQPVAGPARQRADEVVEPVGGRDDRDVEGEYGPPAEQPAVAGPEGDFKS